MKHIIIFIALIGHLVIGQDNKGGRPYSLDNNISIESIQIEMPTLNIDELLEEDRNRPPATPFRYGYKFDVDFSLNNSGDWIELNNGDRIWKLSIYTKDAHAICLEYDQFYLPKGTTLFIYNDQKDMIAGAYTNDNNQADMLFATPLIKGDIINIEYYEPASVYGEGIINIDYVIHDYRDILNFSDTRDSRSCGDNVVCDSADGYENQIDATSFLDMGGYICTGSMLNNTSFDLTPYYWTAWHCVVGDNISTFRFYFDYETSSCGGSWASQGT